MAAAPRPWWEQLSRNPAISGNAPALRAAFNYRIAQQQQAAAATSRLVELASTAQRAAQTAAPTQAAPAAQVAKPKRITFTQPGTAAKPQASTTTAQPQTQTRAAAAQPAQQQQRARVTYQPAATASQPATTQPPTTATTQPATTAPQTTSYDAYQAVLAANTPTSQGTQTPTITAQGTNYPQPTGIGSLVNRRQIDPATMRLAGTTNIQPTQIPQPSYLSPYPQQYAAALANQPVPTMPTVAAPWQQNPLELIAQILRTNGLSVPQPAAVPQTQQLATVAQQPAYLSPNAQEYAAALSGIQSFTMPAETTVGLGTPGMAPGPQMTMDQTQAQGGYGGGGYGYGGYSYSRGRKYNYPGNPFSSWRQPNRLGYSAQPQSRPTVRYGGEQTPARYTYQSNPAIDRSQSERVTWRI